MGSGRAKVKSVLASLGDRTLVRGEIWVAPEVLESLRLPNNAAGIAQLAHDLGADLCFVSCGGPQAILRQTQDLHEAAAEVHNRGLACGAVVDGPWQRLVGRYDLLPLLARLGNPAHKLDREIAVQTALVQEEIQAWADAGADLILLPDDLAYTGGLYFSPGMFSRLLLPDYHRFMQTAGDLQVPLGFHSDGDLALLMPMLVETGFAFYSLEPEVMNLRQLQGQFSDMTLLGGIRAEWLNPSRAAWIPADAMAAEISALAHNGRLILGSTCGLYDPASLDALREIYRVVANLK